MDQMFRWQFTIINFDWSNPTKIIEPTLDGGIMTWQNHNGVLDISHRREGPCSDRPVWARGVSKDISKKRTC
jgi:hypothetical protein